jgi:hypothetical protein
LIFADQELDQRLQGGIAEVADLELRQEVAAIDKDRDPCYCRKTPKKGCARTLPCGQPRERVSRRWGLRRHYSIRPPLDSRGGATILLVGRRISRLKELEIEHTFAWTHGGRLSPTLIQEERRALPRPGWPALPG